MQNMLLYINWDGFGQYYFRQMPDREQTLPTLTGLMKEGVFFENAYTGIPSITYPMQCAIVSGCYSDGTGNCDKFWDREKNEIVLQRRFNRAKTIGEQLREKGIPFVSVQQFALQDKGAEYGEKNSLYVQPNGNFDRRFEVLNELLLSRRIRSGRRVFEYEKMPDVIFAYMDDLDAVGHNPPSVGARTEQKRIEMVQAQLCEMDRALGRTLDLLKKSGQYEHTYFLLTSDHGMLPFWGASKLPQLKKALRDAGCGRVVSQTAGPISKKNFDVLLTAHDIQCQVYFTKERDDQERIKAELLKLPFVEQVLTKEELRTRGVCEEYADMLVSPTEGNYFGTEGVPLLGLHASHDSLHEKCQKVFAFACGPGLKRGYNYKQSVSTIEFLPLLCRCMRLPVMEHVPLRKELIQSVMK